MKNIIKILLVISAFLIIIGLLMPRAALVPVVTQKPEIIGAEPPMSYQIPSNAIPTLDEIDESIKKSEEIREENERALETTMKKDMLGIQEKREPAAIETEKESIAPGEYPGERKKVVFPTFEERKRMQSQGIICH